MSSPPSRYSTFSKASTNMTDLQKSHNVTSTETLARSSKQHHTHMHTHLDRVRGGISVQACRRGRGEDGGLSISYPGVIADVSLCCCHQGMSLSCFTASISDVYFKPVQDRGNFLFVSLFPMVAGNSSSSCLQSALDARVVNISVIYPLLLLLPPQCTVNSKSMRGPSP